jgi:phosphoglucomutase
MRFSAVTVATIGLIAVVPIVSTTNAFVPGLHKYKHGNTNNKSLFGIKSTTTTKTTGFHSRLSSVATIMREVETKSIPGMKPGTSGLRKKVEVWQGIDPDNKNYLENFIQSLIDTAINKNNGIVPNTILVAGDGRYYNTEAIQIICRVLAGNGIENIWIPLGGIMSTPAVSAAIRTRDVGQCDGSIVLTASHNPGGPGEDFGIKYNLAYGQPAGEDFTDEVRFFVS